MNTLERIRSAFRPRQPAAKPDPEPYAMPGGPEHRALLREMNADIPPGVDWTGGAQRYVAAEVIKHGLAPITNCLLTKPFGVVPPGDA
jgi:hypothetical protein